MTHDERQDWTGLAMRLTVPSVITTAKIHGICRRLREHRTTCTVCVGETHFAGNSGMLAEPPVTICGEAKLILLDIFV